jgi:hypothetical protein
MELLLGVLLTETHTRIEKELERIGQKSNSYQESSEAAFVAQRSFPF